MPNLIVRKLTQEEIEEKKRKRENMIKAARENGIELLDKDRTVDESIALLKSRGVKLTEEQIKEAKEREILEKTGYEVEGETYVMKMLCKIFNIPETFDEMMGDVFNK